MSPVGGHRTYNPDGELATARAAKAKKHLQVLSTVTTTSVEDVNAARGEPVWFQLYQRDDWGRRGSCSSASKRLAVRPSCSPWICSAAATWNSSIACSSATGSSAAPVTSTASR